MGSRQDSGSPKSPYSRAIQVGLRSVHIVAMGLVLGGVALNASPRDVRVPLLLTLASGLLLLAATVWWRCVVLSQGSGWALFLKLGLLGLASAVPGLRLELIIAATLVTSVASHMPASWRHRPLPWRRPQGEQPPPI